MGPDLEPEEMLKAVKEEVVLVNNENGSLPHDCKDKLMDCVSNFEDQNFGEENLVGGGQANVLERNEDMEINITECTASGGDRLVVPECQDTTENSSSFGGTISGDENGSSFSDAEVESAVDVSSLGSVFDGYLQMRKRKLTDHWRRFIRPIMWRCKWLELQLKEFESRALMYDKELAEYDQIKKLEFEKLTFEGLDVKSQPFPCSIQRKKIMKRRKRKRVEETADLASYMLCHNLFSYYERKKAVAPAAVNDDNGKLEIKSVNSNDDIWFNNGLSSLEFKDSDTWSEKILRKIDVVQSQVHKLKTRVDKVVTESPQKFSSINLLSSLVPCDALMTSRSRSSPPRCRERIPVQPQCTSSQNVSDCNRGDPFVPGNTISSHGEVTPFSSIMEGTSQRLAGISYENSEDDILINNQAAKEELRNFQSGLTQQADEPQKPLEISRTDSIVVAPGRNPPASMCHPSVQPNGKSFLTSKPKGSNKKRKRGKRKPGPGRGRKSSG